MGSLQLIVEVEFFEKYPIPFFLCMLKLTLHTIVDNGVSGKSTLYVILVFIRYLFQLQILVEHTVRHRNAEKKMSACNELPMSNLSLRYLFLLRSILHIIAYNGSFLCIFCHFW